MEKIEWFTNIVTTLRKAGLDARIRVSFAWFAGEAGEALYTFQVEGDPSAPQEVDVIYTADTARVPFPLSFEFLGSTRDAERLWKVITEFEEIPLHRSHWEYVL